MLITPLFDRLENAEKEMARYWAEAFNALSENVTILQKMNNGNSPTGHKKGSGELISL